MVLAFALLATFVLWPDIDLPLFPLCKYSLLFISALLLFKQYLQLCRWRLTFSLDEYGRGLQTEGDSFRLGPRSFVTPWLVICFFERAGQTYPQFLFADMFSDTDYRSLCRLIINQRLPPADMSQ